MLIIILLYLPVALVIIYSFNQSKTSAVWTGFTLDWYSKMAENRRLIDSLMISIKVALMTAAISCILGTAGAVAVSGFKERSRKIAGIFMFIPLIIPEIILGVALLMFFSVTPLKYGTVTIVLAHTAFCIPYVFILVTIRLRAVERSLIEAARDLGAKPIKAFFSITLPLIMPAIISGALLSITMSLDDVVISSFVTGPESTTLPIRIYSMLRIGITPEINALSTIMIAVMFTIIGIIQLFSVRKKIRDNS